MNKSLKEIKESQEKTMKHRKEAIHTVQDLKTEIDKLKKTQNERIMEIVKFGIQWGTTDVNMTNR